MQKILLYIAGKKGSGKSTLIEMFSKHGYYTTELRFNLEKALSTGEINPKSIPIPFYWTDEMLEFTFRKIRDKHLVVLTGLYNTKDLQQFHNLGFRVVVVSVIAEDKIRYERTSEREREKGNPLNIEDLIYKDSKRDGTAKGFEFNNNNDLMALSQYVIKNEADFQDFERSFSELLLSLRINFPNEFTLT
jgi:dephospho-CoA kinase